MMQKKKDKASIKEIGVMMHVHKHLRKTEREMKRLWRYQVSWSELVAFCRDMNGASPGACTGPRLPG